MEGIIMNILSLFDGLSCGRIAAERAGIEVENYYADTIAMIFEMRQRGEMVKDIAKIFNVTPKNMSNLITKARSEGFDAFPKRVEK